MTIHLQHPVDLRGDLALDLDDRLGELIHGSKAIDGHLGLPRREQYFGLENEAVTDDPDVLAASQELTQTAEEVRPVALQLLHLFGQYEIEAGAEIILLDNLTTDEIAEAVKRCRGRAKTEISGGVTLRRMPELAATGADYVSIGALTHSAPAMDLSFEIEPL